MLLIASGKSGIYQKSHYESTSVVPKNLHHAIIVSEPWPPLSKVPFDGLQGWAWLRAPATAMGDVLGPQA
jgi:hypothetical protein